MVNAVAILKRMLYNSKKEPKKGHGMNTTLCYLKQNGCYLMLYRNKKKNDPNGGKWLGVGGKLEPGETPLQGVIREVKEETGLCLTDASYRGLVIFRSDVYPTERMHLFVGEAFTGTLQECDEGQLEWIPIARVPQLPLWEGDRLFLPLLEKDLPFFTLDLQYEKDRLVQAVLNGERIR